MFAKLFIKWHGMLFTFIHNLIILNRVLNFIKILTNIILTREISRKLINNSVKISLIIIALLLTTLETKSYFGLKWS